MKKNRSTRKVLATSAAILTAVSLAACSSGGKAKGTSSDTAGNAGVASTPRVTVAMVTHSAPGDVFWDMVRKGAEAAAKKDNVKLQYSADPDATKQAALVQAATDKKVNGIAVTLANPKAMASAVASAEKAGIPVVGLNSGQQYMAQDNLLGFFGQDDGVAGEEVGKKLKASGAQHPLCVMHEQGNIGLQARCAGIKKYVPGTVNIYVNGQDPTSVQSGITAKLQQDKSIDYVVSLNAGVTTTAVKSIKEAGSKAKLVSFDTSADVVKAIQDGTVDFAVDQQPWLQGYLAVDSLWLYLTNGDTIGGGSPTLTGPSFVDKSNVNAVAKYAANGTR
nr:substrate-binding domain-containing protein [Flexivirga oryzae]